MSSNFGRRDFLKTSALTVAGAAISIRSLRAEEPAEKREHSNKGKIFIANKGGSIGNGVDGIVATLEQYRKLGFDGIEGDSPGLKVADAKVAIEKTKFPIHGVVDSVHWVQRLSSPDEAVRKIGLDALIQAVRDSKEIGGSAVLLVPGKVTGEDENHDQVWERSIVEIRKALPVAEELKIKILIENVWNGFCETPEQYRDYIDEIGSEWCGAYFDIGNVRRFGKPEEWIEILGKRIGKLDVKDWGEKNSFCRLGEGDVDWPAVRAALKQVGYTGWATREGADKSLEDTVELMNKLLDL
ncbi:sugar phosphate isomerase/epimerase family protein [Planctomicrobium sp. SH668]|uniref:sugar phosphate isomerase/epimerase family protein n=1 Tax=Planctomicrobium sp. SH668 TaxID=3448126 RepID=UPI003F5CAF04